MKRNHAYSRNTNLGVQYQYASKSLKFASKPSKLASKSLKLASKPSKFASESPKLASNRSELAEKSLELMHTSQNHE
ncbi:hypothetical protein [Peribacillus sp. SI8-4]|uniref:hypothetical protein n=1 Tax=Peribacillus sp. SI8-4 TaxID=3048009 RepID=UPI002554C5BD|nr:hypothetical protein [Peribacillus sp. SI8-4]